MTPSTALAPAQKKLIDTVRKDEFEQRVRAALPQHVSEARFVQIAATAILEMPKLAECEPASVIRAFLHAAQDGLLPDSREAAILPYGDKAQYVPMIGGYRKIASEFGWTIESACVYEADEFTVQQGLNPVLDHFPTRPGVERGEIIAAYAIGRHRSHPPVFEVVYQAEIDKAKGFSKTASRNDSPWNVHPETMWQKTAGRRIFPKLPLGERDPRVVRLSADELEDGEAAAALYGAVPNPAAGIDPGAPEPEPEFKAPAGEPEQAVSEAEAAGQVSFAGDGPHAGKTIAKVWNEGPDGEKYVRWSASRFADPEIKAACAVYVAAYGGGD